MDTVIQIFGEGKDLNTLQMTVRAIIMFVITLVFIRIAGAKTFGKNSAFDNVIIIMLGAVLSRGVVGASPFLGVVMAGLAMVLMNRFISWLSIHNKTFSLMVKGRHTCLYEKGAIKYDNLHKSLLSEHDMMEGVRKQANTNSLKNINEIFLECNGEISVIKKEEQC